MLKNPKGSPLSVFLHCETFISKFFFSLARHSVHFFGFSIFEYCKLTLGSPFAILSLGYAADLGRSRLVVDPFHSSPFLCATWDCYVVFSGFNVFAVSTLFFSIGSVRCFTFNFPNNNLEEQKRKDISGKRIFVGIVGATD